MSTRRERLEGVTNRALEVQQRIVGSVPFGPLYLLVTVWWVREAVHLGWDNSGLTIYTFLVSVLAIYFNWVVTNILNRTSAHDAERDNLEAQEVERLLTMNQRQLEILELLHEMQRTPTTALAADMAAMREAVSALDWLRPPGRE